MYKVFGAIVLFSQVVATCCLVVYLLQGLDALAWGLMILSYPLMIVIGLSAMYVTVTLIISVIKFKKTNKISAFNPLSLIRYMEEESGNSKASLPTKSEGFDVLVTTTSSIVVFISLLSLFYLLK